LADIELVENQAPSCCAQTGSRLSDRVRAVVLALLLSIVTAIVFWPVTQNALVNYDDPDYITNNPRVLQGISWHNIGWAFTTGHAGNYLPMTWISLMIDRTLQGTSPEGFHTTNLVLHAINCGLLLLVLRAATGSTWRSALAAAIFALHPLRVESVAWVTERKDVLSMFFALCAMAAYVLYAHGPRVWKYLAVAALLELALLSKSTIVTLPAIFLLMDFWPLRRVRLDAGDTRPLKRSVKTLLLEKIPLLMLSVGACVGTMLTQMAGGTVGTLAKYPLQSRICNALVCYVIYLKKMVIPTNLAVFYPNHQDKTLWMAALAFIALGAITGLVLLRRDRSPWLAVGWLWFCGAMVPMIGLVQSGGQSMADRFTYLPMIGIVIAAAWSVPQWMFETARGRAMLGSATVAVLIAMSLGTRQQISYWQNSETLMSHAIAVTSGNHVAHNNLGFELARQGRMAEAKTQYLAALEANPGFSVAHNGLGTILARQGDRAGAIAQYSIAVKLNPENEVAHRNLGVQLAAAGRIDDAIAQYAICVRIKAEDAAAQSLLGMTLAQQNRLAEAEPHFRAAVDDDPNDAQLAVNLGHLLVEMKRPAEALPVLRQALALDPKSGEAHYHTGAALAQLGDASGAAAEFGAVLKLQPGDRAAQAALEQVIVNSQQRTASAAE